MEMLLNNYIHNVEDVADCYTMHIKDILNTGGINISAAMCFGLSSALSFSYWIEKNKVSMLIASGRRLDWLKSCTEKFKIKIKELMVTDKNEFKELVIKSISEKFLVLCYTDRFYLPYLGEKFGNTHFGLHIIGICGIKCEDNMTDYAILDFISDKFNWCSEEDITSARTSELTLFRPSTKVLLVENAFEYKKIDIENLICTSIVETCHHMLDEENYGLNAMDRLCKEFEKLLNFDLNKIRSSLKVQLKLLKLSIEVETTHSLYRKLYANFLTECIQKYNLSYLEGFDIEFCEIAQKWINLNDQLDLNDNNVKYIILKLINNMKKIMELEKLFFITLKNKMDSKVTT